MYNIPPWMSYALNSPNPIPNGMTLNRRQSFISYDRSGKPIEVNDFSEFVPQWWVPRNQVTQWYSQPRFTSLQQFDKPRTALEPDWLQRRPIQAQWTTKPKRNLPDRYYTRPTIDSTAFNNDVPQIEQGSNRAELFGPPPVPQIEQGFNRAERFAPPPVPQMEQGFNRAERFAPPPVPQTRLPKSVTSVDEIPTLRELIRDDSASNVSRYDKLGRSEIPSRPIRSPVFPTKPPLTKQSNSPLKTVPRAPPLPISPPAGKNRTNTEYEGSNYSQINVDNEANDMNDERTYDRLREIIAEQASKSNKSSQPNISAVHKELLSRVPRAPSL